MGYNNEALINIQIEYSQLLTKFLPQIENINEIELSNLLSIIDEVKLFWYKRLPLIEFELEHWAKSKESLLLSGAIYLDVKDNEHFFFNLFGEYHVVDDPLLKLEGFFRVSSENFKDESILNVFKRAYLDTLEVTKNYSNAIHILPAKEIVNKYNPDNQELIETFYWRFISTIFKKEVKNSAEFFKSFTSLSDIEKELDQIILDNLVFVDKFDNKLTLEERCEKYKVEFPQFRGLTNLQIINVATFSYVAQIIDLLLITSFLGFTPYIRNDITFRYFLLLKDTFIEEPSIRIMVEKSIIIYIMYNTVSLERLNKYNFDEFYKLTREGNILARTIDRLNSCKIEVIYSKVKPIQKIIDEEIDNLLKTF
ncbi:hypothetical protein [Neobacillus terrae]|uniref:hypothetical protein n=1 Tax=Neobacillus terrae TaxID=3034837 RepID=UPI00140B0785|nr:hypothetical protein [Neobacillus terrae]NHM29018.1 hypothetical protein [Neobacillus terrae]